MERKKFKIILPIVGIMLLVVIAVVGVKYKEHQEDLKRQEVVKKEEAKAKMLDIADKFIETLNNREYEAHIDLHSKEGIECFDGMESVYEFLDGYEFGDSREKDYEDISFQIVKTYDDELKKSLNDLDYEKFIHEGVAFVVEFGNSELKYRQKWTFEFVIEDGEMKIDGGVWLSKNVLWEVEEK